jgi:GntR family transcriptional regulator, carbon starvation induced regulator
MSTEKKSASTTLTDLAYARLREDILSGQLMPGMKLRVEHLKAAYGTGASPIREALSRLTGDGLTHAEGRRGFRVSEVSRDELMDITDLRILMETRSLALAIEAGDDDWEAGILASFHRLSKLDEDLNLRQPGKEWEERHRDFHSALVCACPSRWLKYFREILFDQSERYRRLALSNAPGQRPVAEEHRAIMEASLERDVTRACELLTAHMRATAEAVARSDLVRD